MKIQHDCMWLIYEIGMWKRGIKNNKNFVVSIAKLLSNNNIKKKCIIKNGFIAKAMLLMKNLDINEHQKWINYEEYYFFLKIIIKKYKFWKWGIVRIYNQNI